MFKITTLFLLLLNTLFSAQNISYDKYLDATLNSNYIQKQLERAKKEDKTVIIQAAAEGCHFCERMNKNVFNQKEVRDSLEKSIIFIKINITNNPKTLPLGLHQKFVGVTPTFFVLNSNLEFEKRVLGSMTKFEFLAFIEMYEK